MSTFTVGYQPSILVWISPKHCAFKTVFKKGPFPILLLVTILNSLFLLSSVKHNFKNRPVAKTCQALAKCGSLQYYISILRPRGILLSLGRKQNYLEHRSKYSQESQDSVNWLAACAAIRRQKFKYPQLSLADIHRRCMAVCGRQPFATALLYCFTVFPTCKKSPQDSNS